MRHVRTDKDDKGSGKSGKVLSLGIEGKAAECLSLNTFALVGDIEDIIREAREQAVLGYQVIARRR